MKNLIRRLPFTIISAIGLVSLSSSIIQLDDALITWIDLWKSFTVFFWGWLELGIFGIYEAVARSYLTMGLIVFGMLLRLTVADLNGVVVPSNIRVLKDLPNDFTKFVILAVVLPAITLIIVLFWPFIFFYYMLNTLLSLYGLLYADDSGLTIETRDRNGNLVSVLGPELEDHRKHAAYELNLLGIFWESAVYALLIVGFSGLI